MSDLVSFHMTVSVSFQLMAFYATVHWGGEVYSTQVYIHVGRHHPEVQPLTFLDTILTEMLPLLYNFNLTKVPHSHTFITGPYYEQIKKKALLSFSCNVG